MKSLLTLCLVTFLSVVSLSQSVVRLPERPDDPYVPTDVDGRERTPPYRFSSPGFFFTQVNIDSFGQNIVGDAGNEPSIAVDPNDNNRIVIGWRQFDTITNNFRQAGNGYTTDGGLTWIYHDVIERGIFRSDPVLDADADGNVYYNSLTTQGPDFVCQVFKSTDGGATWDGGTAARGGDKQWMAIDRTGGIGHGNIYSNWTVFFSSCPPGFFTRSPNNGLSFDPCVTVPGEPYWGTLSVGGDGDVFFGGADLNNGGFQVVRSTTAKDPGQTVSWDASVNIDLNAQVAGNQGNSSPNPGGILGQVWVETDHSTGPTANNVYILCSSEPDGSSDPLDVMFARSTDDGLTWSAPVRVNDDTGNEWQWFGTMSVAPNGRIDVIWLDTRDNPGTVLSSLYYSASIDGGVTWSPNTRLTDEFDPHIGWPNQNKMGDYYDMVSDNEGAHLAWAATFNGGQDVYYARILAEDFIPEAPLLSLPLNGAVLQPLSLALVWEGALGASAYHAQLDVDGSFNAPIAEDSTLTDRFMEVGGLATASTYYWRARAKSSGGSFGPWSETWSFTTGANPPAAPQQVSPPDMATGIATTTTFEWNDTTAGATWGFQIAIEDNFLDPVVDLSGLTAASNEVAGLAGETMHYWRVNAVTAGGTSIWSAPWSFTTAIAPPMAPALLAPPDGFVNSSTTVLFRWNGADGASTYHFQLATDDQFSFIAVNDSTLTATTRITSNLTDGEEYFWRVAAENDGGKSVWSDFWSVTVLLTGVDQAEGLPTEYSLGQNYPNPFNPTTVISFDVPRASHVDVEVFDILGKQVAVLASREYEPGRYTVSFDAGSLGGGVYFYRMTGQSFTATKKLLLMK